MNVSNTNAVKIWFEDPAKHLEHCGRICYNSFKNQTGDSALPFIEHKIKAKHWSVLEHAGVVISDSTPNLDKLDDASPEFGLVLARASLGGIRFSDLIQYSSEYDTFEKAVKAGRRDASLLSFDITCSRYISQQLERHRNLSYSERSLRFVKMTEEDFSIVIPDNVSKESYKLIEDQAMNAIHIYNNLIDAGCTKDDARSVLPLCTATRVAATAQVSWWLDFLTKRFHPAASREMVKLCQSLFKQMPSKVVDVMNTKYKEQMEEALKYAKISE